MDMSDQIVPMESDNVIMLSDEAVAYLEREFREGLESVEKEGGWISEEAMRARYASL